MKTYYQLLSSILLLLAVIPVRAQYRGDLSSINHIDSVAINFQQGKWDIDRSLGNNAAALDGIDKRLTTVLNDSLFHLRHVSIFGSSSPDGTAEFNEILSRRRAETLFGWFDKYNQLSDINKSYTLLGRDWAGVLELAMEDPSVPYKNETVALLQTIVDEKNANNGEEPANSLERLKALRNGVPYMYLYQNVFPSVRASKLVVYYDKILAPEIAAQREKEAALVEEAPVLNDVDTVTISAQEAFTEIIPLPEKKFYMDIRSNMLYDVLALPNIGVDFYLGKNISIGANWLYGWWKTDRHQRYWRAYGGELNARWWFGKAAHKKPLTGHHLGVYGQAYTYDFEWGGDGEMGGKPGGNLWDRLFWAAGLEYGYSLPMARRINIDFSLGLGYTEGTYYKYKPIEGHYVWQSTHKRHYWGPTKLEIAFVWLIGNGNANEKKGGKK